MESTKDCLVPLHWTRREVEGLLLAVTEASARRRTEEVERIEVVEEAEIHNKKDGLNLDLDLNLDWQEVARDVQMYCEMGKVYNADNRSSLEGGPTPIVEQYWNYSGNVNFNNARIHTRKRFFDIGKIKESRKNKKQ